MSKKVITCKIIKKNRKYFKIQFNNGFEAKLLICQLSENLPISNENYISLEVNDISVSSKYGTDTIYSVVNGEFSDDSKKVILKTDFYNVDLVNCCKRLGGKFDDTTKTWAFSKIVEEQVEELDFVYNSKKVPVEITSQDKLSELCGPILFHGFVIARASGRDSGAFVGEGVSILSGDVSSGGSVKNWLTIISNKATFRLYIPEEITKRENFLQDELFDVTIL